MAEKKLKIGAWLYNYIFDNTFFDQIILQLYAKMDTLVYTMQNLLLGTMCLVSMLF